MSDIDIRIKGRTGRITLQRPKALNALTYDMAMAIYAALKDWADNDTVQLVVIDAEGDKAFCAGGDIQDLYDTGTAGDFAYGQKFWRDEYRLNARLAEYHKPIVSFMQGFVMGGGVGVGCHVSHRIVDDSTQIAMPECGIGLVPDVGGSMILAHAPGQLGAYLGLTAARMGPGDAIRAGFADRHIARADWPQIIAELEDTGTTVALPDGTTDLPTPLADDQALIDACFTGTLEQIKAKLAEHDEDISAQALKALGRNSPLAMAVALEMLKRLGPDADIREALTLEYRFTARAMEHGDFLEGIRAQIIDRDRNPQWKHQVVSEDEIEMMLSPLPDELDFEEETA
ncbi:enoyl-CoA hydratase/isomerase family protein [Pseudooceanicola sp. MF1-13]|uniref:enoyl-CoA hydratase/isomerase family protein n=1 Tax=Pseudooceanicola sp. MF1-13 TaxID=3379095 RepID=UPI003891F9B0